METAKRVIILKRLNSPLIAQAIFILKDDRTDEFSAVVEAERIVEEFMYNPSSSKHKEYAFALIFTILAVAGVLLVLLFR